jgi:hypothetical protein
VGPAAVGCSGAGVADGVCWLCCWGGAWLACISARMQRPVKAAIVNHPRNLDGQDAVVPEGGKDEDGCLLQ